jgi:lactate dehydrogenase-like 2-hydroxyacid dehydrogenase
LADLGPHRCDLRLSLKSAVLIPHLGSATVQTRLAMANLAADNLLAGLEDRHPPALLNPEAWQQRAPKG